MLSNPLIIIVPGAWHSPSHFCHLVSQLGQLGFAVDSTRNSSCPANNNKDASISKDAKHIRSNVLLPHIEAGKEVIVIMHSYGGICGSVAISGLSKSARAAAKKPGGVIGIIYISAFLANENQGLIDLVPGGKPADWTVRNEEKGTLTVSNPISVFYNECSQIDAQVATAQLREHAAPTFRTSSSDIPAWKESEYDGRRAYLHCLQDNAIPLIAQQAMVSSSGVQWITHQLDTDHSPFLSRTRETAEWITQIIGKFTPV